MALKILRPSPLCTLQDLGRRGASLAGVSQSGAADEYAFCSANMLLQNPLNTPMLEIAYGNALFKATKDLFAVVTGAKTRVKVDNQPIAMWRTFKMKKNQTLSIEIASSGQWIYLGIKGEVLAKKLFNSASTSIRENLGGKQFKSGDEFMVLAKKLPHIASLKAQFIPDYSDPLTLRVVLGYQSKNFLKTSLDNFFKNQYTITTQSSRMGYRLEGEPIKYEGRGIISEPIAFGAIQIPPHGQPIILLKERQSIGGYPKIGSVLGIDCFKLAQRKPGQKVQFLPIDANEASLQMAQFYKEFNAKSLSF
jgi:biotin-dependent carboxylase-like uncharacterized protein